MYIRSQGYVNVCVCNTNRGENANLPKNKKRIEKNTQINTQINTPVVPP